MDLCIRSGTIVTARDTFTADLGVNNGQIAQVGGTVPAAKREIDAANLLVMPGAIDVHTHMDMPFMGTATSDDFATGTRAAAAGGVTCILDFAIQDKASDLLDTIAVWNAKAAGKAVVDYCFHVAVTRWFDDLPKQVRALIEKGFPSFKAFMAYKNDVMLDDEHLLRLLQTTKQHGGLVMVHAENGDAVSILQQQALERGETEPRYHALTRPQAVEGEATARAITLAMLAASPLYVVHVSCEDSIHHINSARYRGLPVFGESCPQYLGAISCDDYDRREFEGAKFVCSPPLRPMAQSDHVWAAIRANTLQLISSDHCPFTFEQKRAGINDFTLIPNGVPGVETLVPLAWSLGVNRGLISPNRFVDLISTTPARMFGLSPRKGTLTVGADADIFLLDPVKEVTLNAAHLHQNIDYTPYEGFLCRGYPVLTISRGDVIWEGGEHHCEDGRGKLTKRRRFDPKELT